MKIAFILIIGAWLACNAWARVGETPEEAAARYGLTRSSYAGAYSNTIVRIYNKDGIRVDATFMTSKTGKSIVGEIKYTLPRAMRLPRRS